MNRLSAIPRRKFLLGLGAAGLAACTWPRRAQAADEETITPEAQKAIERGLDYLVREQKTGGRFAGAYGAMGYPSGVAVTAMAGLAMLASGDPPGEGKYGKALDRSIDYIARAVQDTGFISVANGMDQMYGHGFATMFLSEIVGMSRRRDDLRDKVKKAVELIVTCQNDQGGWRYAPQKSDADLSITICQIMALRAASDSGLSVPKETRAKAIDYVKRSQRPDGGFMYMLPQGQVTFPLTAAGVVSLYSAGIFQGREIESGLKYLMRFMPGRGGTESVGHYFYGHYYAVQAMWHAGGDYWRQWYPAIRQELLSRQQANGSWQDPSVCEQFGTAVACIILQMPNNALPIFAE